MVGADETAAKAAAGALHDTVETVAKVKADAAADVIKWALLLGALVFLASGAKLPRWLKL